MKTLVDVMVTQYMRVLVESEDSADVDDIVNAVDEAYADGLLYDFSLEEEEHEAHVVNILKSDASEIDKAYFERGVCAYVDARNKFNLADLLEE